MRNILGTFVMLMVFSPSVSAGWTDGWVPQPYDKVAHFFGSAFLVYIVFHYLHNVWKMCSRVKAQMFAVIAVITIGVGKEFVDDYLSRGDLIADFAGVLTGFIIILMLQRKKPYCCYG